MESVGVDYGVSKSTVCETIQWVEDTLKRDKTFCLPGKRMLKEAENTIEYIVVDVTESPIQRPKKTKSVLFGEKEAAYDKNASDYQPGEPEYSGYSGGRRQCP
ncbi:hypothetical protein AGMMS49579_15660 [Spirochaetia bacterium]|nr:hypothetical protein AGMMS49579_15660 [Spirochaetia bacterium]